MTYYNNEVDDDNDVANEEEMKTFSDTASWGHMGVMIHTLADPLQKIEKIHSAERKKSLQRTILIQLHLQQARECQANFNCDVSYIEHMNAFPSKLIITESIIRISIKNEKEAGNHPISNKRIQEDEKYGVFETPRCSRVVIEAT